MKKCASLFAATLATIALVHSFCWSSPSGGEEYNQNAKGLEKQFEPFLKAYEKGDEQAQTSAFRVFQIPNAKKWFSEYFRPEDAEQLAWDADAETDREAETLRLAMNMVSRGGRFHGRCTPDHSGPGSVKERQSKVDPLKPVPVEQFTVEMVDEKSGKKFSSLGNFVFVDGAYRFVGNGAFPLWSMPDMSAPAKKQ